MSITALAAAQNFCDAIGYPRPSALVGNLGDDYIQMLALMNQCGREIASRYDWQVLTFECTFTAVATESQGTVQSLVGAQTLKRIVNDTIWDRTSRLPFYGPLSNREWQRSIAMTTTGPYPQFRVRGGELIMTPVPTAGDVCYFEYITKNWSSSGISISADTDTFLIDDELIMAGLEWRWLRKKGLSYAQEFESYELLVAQAITNDKPRPTIRMDDPPNEVRRGTFVPIGSWNL